MKKITTSLALLAAGLTIGSAGIAQARHGADDPVGHDRGDDHGVVRHHVRDARHHHRHRHRHRHGADDPAGHR